MRDIPLGNGSGKHEIDVTFLAPDWAHLQSKRPEPWPEDLPFGLCEVLFKWFQTVDNIRIRTVLPVVKDGNLVGIHVWFDKVSE
jgi:hypothetical protein